METSAKYTKLIGELCRRNIAVAFAATYAGGNVLVQWKRSGDPMAALGLAARLYHEVPAGLTDKDAPATEPQADLSQQIREACPPITDYADLSFITTPAIIAELYRLEGEWVLGLQKKDREGHFVQFVLWYGSAVSCCGLAAILQHRISEALSHAADNAVKPEENPIPINGIEGRTRFFLADLVDGPTYDPLQIGGTCAHMTFEANRFRPRGPGSMNTAQDYLVSDDPLCPPKERP